MNHGDDGLFGDAFSDEDELESGRFMNGPVRNENNTLNGYGAGVELQAEQIFNIESDHEDEDERF